MPARLPRQRGLGGRRVQPWWRRSLSASRAKHGGARAGLPRRRQHVLHGRERGPAGSAVYTAAAGPSAETRELGPRRAVTTSAAARASYRGDAGQCGGELARLSSPRRRAHSAARATVAARDCNLNGAASASWTNGDALWRPDRVRHGWGERSGHDLGEATAAARQSKAGAATERGVGIETGGFFPTGISPCLCASGQESTPFLSHETVSTFFLLFPR